MKIKMITFHTPKNYGAVLQAYSLYSFFKMKNFDTQIIDFSPDSLIKRYRIIPRSGGVKGIIKNAISLPLYAPIRRKFQKFDRFVSDNMSLTRRYVSCDALAKTAWSKDAVFVTGSDQVFNPMRMPDERKVFYLDFVPQDHYKFSYAASFGERSIPKDKEAEIATSLDSFNRLSVREKRGLENIKSVTDMPAVEVLDPVFLNSVDFWHKTEKTYSLQEHKYILYYRLLNRKDSDEAAREIQKKLGLKLVVVTQGLFKGIQNCRVLYDVGPEELLSLYHGSDYVITDSFHGVAFSIIYNKQFSFVDKRPETNGRGLNLMERLGIVDGDSIEYCSVNEKLNALIEKSSQYINSCLDEAEQFNEYRMIPIEKIGDRCTGCGACMSVCPTNAIDLIQNTEGFYYPVVTSNKCVKCGKCDRTCHILNPIKADNQDRCTFYGWNINQQIRNESSSGGAFSAIAGKILSEDGVVYGACFDCKELKLKHESTKSVSIDQLRKSKYIESYMGTTIADIKSTLAKGKKVLFCGTPCEVSGLKSAIKGEKNLLTVDFICHGVPSSKLFSEHIKNKIDAKRLVSIDFRPKERGWTGKNIAITVATTTTTTTTTPYYADTYYFGFITKNAFLRKSCYHCEFRQNHVSDITIADFWQYSKVKGITNDEKGISLVIANTDKGLEVIRKMPEFDLHEIDNKYSDYVYAQKDYSTAESLREQFYKEYERNGFEIAAKKTYMKDYKKRKLKSIVKEMLGRR